MLRIGLALCHIVLILRAVSALFLGNVLVWDLRSYLILSNNVRLQTNSPTEVTNHEDNYSQRQVKTFLIQKIFLSFYIF